MWALAQSKAEKGAAYSWHSFISEYNEDFDFFQGNQTLKLQNKTQLMKGLRKVLIILDFNAEMPDSVILILYK